MTQYKIGDAYKKRNQIQYCFFEKIGSSRDFSTIVSEYGNALVNTNGGFLVFGVCKEIVVGIYLDRSTEDTYRLALDRELRNFSPTVGPNLYRFSLSKLDYRYRELHILEIRISAGPIGSMYQTSQEEVFVVKNTYKVGPLWPQELKALIIKKYQEELLASKAILSSPVRDNEKTSSDDKAKKDNK